MSFFPSEGPRLTNSRKGQWTVAYIKCDLCGRRERAETRKGEMCAWLRKGPRPPKWTGGFHKDGWRLDWCPTCEGYNP